MSEYQYYEFQKVSGRLDDKARNNLRQLSSRAHVTSNKAVYTYSYGDFRYDPEEILAQYFDIMLYMTSFGIRQLMFRFPLDLVDTIKIDPYCVQSVIGYETYGDSLILTLSICDEEGGGWIDGEGVLDDLITLRNDLLSGDFRALYVAWLAAAQFCQVDEHELEPPVPNNLKHLSPGLEALVDYFELDESLLQAGIELSNEVTTQQIQPEELILKLSDKEKHEVLLGLLKDESDLKIKFKRKLTGFIQPQESNTFNRRTVEQLKFVSEKIEQQKKEKMQKEKEAARMKELQSLVSREKIIWKEVYDSIQLKTPKGMIEPLNCFKI